jgi:hypothetical protein
MSSKAAFLAAATPLAITIDGQSHTADVKSFSTGSVGWNVNGKVTVMVNGQAVRCQCSLNLTAIGSKDWPENSPATVAA